MSDAGVQMTGRKLRLGNAGQCNLAYSSSSGRHDWSSVDLTVFLSQSDDCTPGSSVLAVLRTVGLGAGWVHAHSQVNVAWRMDSSLIHLMSGGDEMVMRSLSTMQGMCRVGLTTYARALGVSRAARRLLLFRSRRIVVLGFVHDEEAHESEVVSLLSTKHGAWGTKLST